MAATTHPTSFVVLLPGHRVEMGWKLEIVDNEIEVFLVRDRRLRFTTPHPEQLVELINSGRLEKLDLRQARHAMPQPRNGIPR